MASTRKPIKTTKDGLKAARLDCAKDLPTCYIVQLRGDDEFVSQTQRDEHMKKISELCITTGAGKPYRGIDAQFTAAFQGYVGNFDLTTIDAIRKATITNGRGQTVAIAKNVEKDVRMVPCVDVARENWGAARMTLPEQDFYDRMPLPAPSTLPYHNILNTNNIWQCDSPNGLGKGSTIYVVDVDFVEDDFLQEQGRLRVVSIRDHIPDLEGHGTLVANIAAGDRMGIAPAANIVVLVGMTLVTVAEMIWSFECIYTDDRGKKDASDTEFPAVINISWECNIPGQSLLNLGLRLLVAAGITIVTGSGNSNIPMSNIVGGPQAFPDAIVVGAIDQHSERCRFSNYGERVDIHAPGWAMRKYKTQNIQHGTSFAAPHITGLLASLMAEERTANPTQFKRWTVTKAKKTLMDRAQTRDEPESNLSGAKSYKFRWLAKAPLNPQPTFKKFTTLRLVETPGSSGTTFNVHLPIIGREVPQPVPRAALLALAKKMKEMVQLGSPQPIPIENCEPDFEICFPGLEYNVKSFFRSTVRIQIGTKVTNCYGGNNYLDFLAFPQTCRVEGMRILAYMVEVENKYKVVVPT